MESAELNERVARLERWLHVSWVTAGALLLGFVVAMVAVTKHPNVPTASPTPPSNLEVARISAREIVLLDNNFKPSIRLDGEKTQIHLYSESHVPSVTLTGRSNIGVAIYDGYGWSA